MHSEDILATTVWVSSPLPPKNLLLKFFLAIHHIRVWQSKAPYYYLENTCDNRRDVFAWWGDIVTNNNVRADFASFARNHALRTVYVETEGLINNNQAQLRGKRV